MKGRAIWFPALMALAFLGRSNVAAELVERVVAEVNGEPITSRDLQEALLLDEQWLAVRRQGDSYAARELRRRIERRVLEQLVDETLLVQEARRQGIALSAEEEREVERVFDQRAIEDFGSIDALRAMLAERGVSLERLRRRHRHSFLVRKLLRREMATSDNFVRPIEIRRYYELQRARFETPGKIRFRHILISKRRRGEKRARELAFAVRKQLAAGASWEAVCREHSDGARADQGGRMEVNSPEEIGLEVLRKAVEGLQVGEISEVLETPAAYIICRVDERIPPGVKPFEAVQDEIQRRLRNERRERALERLKARLRAQAAVRIRIEPRS